MREPLHAAHEVPERERVLARGRGHDDRPVHRVAGFEHDRRHAVAAVLRDDLVVVGPHVVGGRLVGDRTLDERGIEAGLLDDLRVHARIVRAHPIVEERVPDRRVPAVDRVVALLAPDERADPHLAPAVRPRPLPRVLLPGLPVDVLEREEPPRDVDRHLAAHVPDPARRLIGVRAHRVEEPLHPFHRAVSPYRSVFQLLAPRRTRL